jgi:hypothetical protein
MDLYVSFRAHVPRRLERTVSASKWRVRMGLYDPLKTHAVSAGKASPHGLYTRVRMDCISGCLWDTGLHDWTSRLHVKTWLI